MERQWKGAGSKRSFVEMQEEMMYIPILDTIQSLLNQKQFATEVCMISNVYDMLSIGRIRL